MINLDPAIVDQDSIRKQKRKRLLTVCAAPVALLLIISGFFLSTALFNAVYNLGYSSKSYEMASGFTNSRLILNWLEPYIAYYDRGVSKLMERKYKEAEEDFMETLKNFPPEEKLCMVYVNLSISIESQADNALSGKNYDQALSLYARAKSYLTSSGCASDVDRQGKDAKAEDLRSRIDDKRNSAISEMNGMTGPDSPDNTTGDNQQQVTDGEVDEILERNIPPSLIRENRGNKPDCLEKTTKLCY